MKIKNIKYGNFRNFEKEGEVTFDTNGKVTIIYGANGDGKTTLHQLFQWILYGKVKFNNTTSADKLYNLKRGEQLLVECHMPVWGEIEFEHNKEHYVVRRKWEYYKQRSGSITHKSNGDEFYVQKQTANYDWKELEHPEAVIEEVIPSGLAPYFFFDGETMIADLKIRGRDSANTLKKALYSIFELEVYEKALRDIGDTNKSQSTLGQLYQKKYDILRKVTSEKERLADIKQVKLLTEALERIENENTECLRQIEEHTRRVQQISEAIGTNKSKKQLEKNRKSFMNDISDKNEEIKRQMKEFGKEIADNYSYLLITEVVKDADKRLYLQVQNEEKKIISGLTKELLMSLLKGVHEKCICGHELGEEERKTLEEWKALFPPASYKSTYDKFTRNAMRYSRKYDEKKLFTYMKRIIDIKAKIRDKEQEIADIDDQLRGAENIDALLDERVTLENEINKLKEKVAKNNTQKGEYDHTKRIRERKITNAAQANGDVQKYEKKITLLQKVSDMLNDLLLSETREYSQMLRKEIQNLVNMMLTSKREVFLTEEFQLQVKDSYGDESKSEGQFAVISFAYIGGILKVLKSHEKFLGKEYPLILDGPFSKLDPQQKKNVATVIPKYATQVIIFSKDPLDEFIEEDALGKVWTICSNAERNNAEIKEGYLWK